MPLYGLGAAVPNGNTGIALNSKPSTVSLLAYNYYGYHEQGCYVYLTDTDNFT